MDQYIYNEDALKVSFLLSIFLRKKILFGISAYRVMEEKSQFLKIILLYKANCFKF